MINKTWSGAVSTSPQKPVVRIMSYRYFFLNFRHALTSHSNFILIIRKICIHKKSSTKAFSPSPLGLEVNRTATIKKKKEKKHLKKNVFCLRGQALTPTPHLAASLM